MYCEPVLIACSYALIAQNKCAEKNVTFILSTFLLQFGQRWNPFSFSMKSTSSSWSTFTESFLIMYLEPSLSWNVICCQSTSQVETDSKNLLFRSSTSIFAAMPLCSFIIDSSSGFTGNSVGSIANSVCVIVLQCYELKVRICSKVWNIDLLSFFDQPLQGVLDSKSADLCVHSLVAFFRTHDCHIVFEHSKGVWIVDHPSPVCERKRPCCQRNRVRCWMCFSSIHRHRPHFRQSVILQALHRTESNFTFLWSLQPSCQKPFWSVPDASDFQISWQVCLRQISSHCKHIVVCRWFYTFSNLCSVFT